jgi:hypothetical protein
MSLAKQRFECIEGTKKPAPHVWRCTSPLVGGLAIAALLSAPLPTQANAPAKTKTTIAAQAGVPKTTSTKENGRAAKAAGLLGILVGLGISASGIVERPLRKAVIGAALHSVE